MPMLSHLRFHRRGASNPTSPTPSSVPQEGPWTSSQGGPQQTQGNSQYLQASQPHQRAPLPRRSKTKSLLLSPSNFGSNSFDVTSFSLPTISQASGVEVIGITASDKHYESNINNNQSPGPTSNNSDPDLKTGFIGGVALKNYQNRRHQAPVGGPKIEAPTSNTSSAPTSGTSGANNVTQTNATKLLPPIKTDVGLGPDGGRYSLPAQASPSFMTSPAGSFLSSAPGKSPSFVTPTDRQSLQQERQNQNQNTQEMQVTLKHPQTMALPKSKVSSGGGATIVGPTVEKNSAPPPKKSKGITFLRPVSTLLMRRKANNSVPDLSPLKGQEEPFNDPRIRGTKVHDWSAPRPRPTPNSTAAPLNANAATQNPGHSSTGLLDRVPPRKLSMSASASALKPSTSSMVSSTEVAVKDASSLPTSLKSSPSSASAAPSALHPINDMPNEASGSREDQPSHSVSIKSQRSRHMSLSGGSLKSSISRHMKSTSSRFSFDMIGAAKQEKILEERHRLRHGEPEEPEPSNMFMEGDERFEGFDMNDFDYDAMIEGDDYEEEIPGHNFDYDENEIIEEEEEEEDLFEYDQQYGAGPKTSNNYDDYILEAEEDNVPTVGLGHLTLQDILSAEQAEREKQQLYPQQGQVQGEEQHQGQNFLQPDTAQSTQEANTSIIEQVVEAAPPNHNLGSASLNTDDSQNFGAFNFQKFNPASEIGSLKSPHSVGQQPTPRDAEGRVIGFACSGTGDTPLGPSPLNSATLQVMDAASGDNSMFVRINSPLSSCGEPSPEAVPLEEQEMFKIHAPAVERLGALADEEKAFDKTQENEFAGEFLNDEFTKGDDAGFDESLFDLDDTDQYGRPIPGAFAIAQKAIQEAREKQKREIEEAQAVSNQANFVESKAVSEAVNDKPASPQKSVRDGSEGPPILAPIMIPTFLPIKQAEGPRQDSMVNGSVNPLGISSDVAHGSQIRGIGPETNPQDIMAYQVALAAAAQKAEADGKFKRESWDVDPMYEYNEDNGLAGYEDEDDDTGFNGYSYDDDNGDGFNMADYENDDMDDYGLGDDDDQRIIEEANATALANDFDGWYGQEFGFYSAPLGQHHQLNNGTKFEYSNGGFFGPTGMSNVNRSASGRVAVREPNLTPITERSEYSNRNSLMSLPGNPLSTSGFASPGLAQLAMMPDNDENMSLSALLRLRSKKWGGSSASSIQGSPRSERADGTNSPRASFMGIGSGLNEHLRNPMSFDTELALGESAMSPALNTAFQPGPPVLGPAPTSAPSTQQNFTSALSSGFHSPFAANRLSGTSSPAPPSQPQYQSSFQSVVASSATTGPVQREFPLIPQEHFTVNTNTVVGAASAAPGATSETLPDLDEEGEADEDSVASPGVGSVFSGVGTANETLESVSGSVGIRGGKKRGDSIASGGGTVRGGT